MPRTRRYEHDIKTNEFYHSSDWQSVRQLALTRDHYLCQVCKRKGIIKQGNTVHHIVPIKDGWNKRLDLGNLETICMACHNKEHFEKGYSKSKKKIRKNKNVVVFKRNPEL